jgi:hypothetical protein
MQMSAAEIKFTETLTHGIDGWDFTDDHILERMEQKGVSKRDLAITLKWGEVIEVNDRGRVVMRLMTGMRKGVVAVVSIPDRSLVTGWFNKPSDNHKTIDMSEYAWKVNVVEYLRGKVVMQYNRLLVAPLVRR